MHHPLELSCIHGSFFTGSLVLVLTKRSPLKLFWVFMEPMLLAFASTSGAVCISKSIEVCEEKLQIDERISKFGVPFFTALQSDGSLIFIVMASSFIADFSGVELSLSDYIVIG